ncbi:hypothetical protein AGNV_098 [Anticarsia gemmatalis multiple nucleopolyhedrovirus]|uniref:Uncharacterized protein n=2 Tax=Anticarsia gemmatalis multiple nucleopolyhedrovirus TaxID=268591 RepID=A0A0S3IY75_9ABAC|nr:hypothetical protein AGNV_098 [Anticarsia gemmatalis multiple nucleopolyhedrovirus]YP_803458.2 hypothetical protein AGNV_098 [Anticarsia gemmatalis nucleopolyhedrovirus]ABI13847.2 hypothetical protein AGNV_098 [Anticarsia gemmatalis multiple nucleopolyhedrovirus]ALR70845.1 hypothetical protein AGNV_098 [Anticarsia gemmatalis multiple nucleopolyhedrovirus]ALR71632.1 hypothetical protein AGNV_098 [Anticarsia gemmatalis multiple nucleopolyhedrovirus]
MIVFMMVTVSVIVMVIVFVGLLPLIFTGLRTTQIKTIFINKFVLFYIIQTKFFILLYTNKI